MVGVEKAVSGWPWWMLLERVEKSDISWTKAGRGWDQEQVCQ